jgi:hypothetical protein
METVGNFPDLAAAKFAQSLLAAEGIESEIPDEFFSGIDWQMGTALHGVRLSVTPEEAEAARSILEPPTPWIEESEGKVGEPKCPRCGSTIIGPPRWKRRIKALTMLAPILLVFYPLVAFAPKSACYACGHRWTTDESAG